MNKNAPAPDLTKGSLVLLRLPGKKTRRNYRVDSIDGEFVTLIEMWQEGPERQWVSSRRIIMIRPKELNDVRVVTRKAPRSAGSS